MIAMRRRLSILRFPVAAHLKWVAVLGYPGNGRSYAKYWLGYSAQAGKGRARCRVSLARWFDLSNLYVSGQGLNRDSIAAAV